VHDPPSRTAGPRSATGLYCYGVVWASSASEQAEGVAGARVTSVRSGDLAGLTSRVPGTTRMRARRRDLLKHLDVLTVALADGPVLPFRFGTVFENEDDLVATLLEGRRDELTRLLREFEGLVELGVKAFFREEAVLAEIVRDNPRVARLREATSKGPEAATYASRIELGELVAAELQARADHEANRILGRLRPLARRIEVDPERLEHRVLRASFLVDRKHVSEFDAAMDEVARQEAGRIEFKYLGPLPPHSFVALEAR
jgi:hypothetical protein